MRILLIQVVLVVGILIIRPACCAAGAPGSPRCAGSACARLAALAIASILFPETWTRVAASSGSGAAPTWCSTRSSSPSSARP